MDADKSRLSRRRLLAGLAVGGVVAAVAVVARKTTFVIRSKSLRRALYVVPRPASLATAEIEDWAAEVGSLFNIAGYAVRLAGVEPLRIVGTRPPQLRRRPFVAVFDLPLGLAMPGSLIYPVAHPFYPQFSLYLADVSSPAHPRRMHALFN